MTDAEKTAAILADLQARCDLKTIWCSELALAGGARRCDFWELSPWASKGHLATAYEIKVSRADFRRDTAVKQREARLFSDYFNYVAPAGLIKPDEVPDWAGLIEWHADADHVYSRLKTKVPAPRRDKDAPSWDLVVGIIRNSGEMRRDVDIMQSKIDMLERRLATASKWNGLRAGS